MYKMNEKQKVLCTARFLYSIKRILGTCVAYLTLLKGICDVPIHIRGGAPSYTEVRNTDTDDNPTTSKVHQWVFNAASKAKRAGNLTKKNILRHKGDNPKLLI